MLRKFKIPLILLAGATLVYFLFFKNKTSIFLGGTPSNETADNAVVKRFPPPGYSGPSYIGPFTWAGVGTPTHGQIFIGWTESEAKAKGYNWT